MVAQSSSEAGGDVLALVDDDTALLHAMAFSFETQGFRVAAFADAESALSARGMALWRCLVLDYRLPGMSGLDFLERLNERRLRPPALLITSTPSRVTRARAAGVGVEIVEKPLLDDVLVERVRQLWLAVV
jgi:two-component system, LuxR family, response regulator FixJ